MRMRLRQLEALLAVAGTGSMTRAAQELGISQPAVSRLLADLEAKVGFQLFDRRGGRLTPTQETRFLLPDVNRVIETLDQIGEMSRNLTDRKAGHLKIACLPGFATSHLPSVLSSFVLDRPGVTVTLEPDRPERILEWIIGEQYDCGITDNFDDHPAVNSQMVNVRTVCVFPKGHALAEKKAIRPKDLSNIKLIHTRRDSVFFRDLNEAFHSDGVEIDALLETRQFTAACELVIRGLGVSIVSELDAAGFVDQGLEFRPFEPITPHQLALVRPINKRPSMITLEFLEAFNASLAPFIQSD